MGKRVASGGASGSASRYVGDVNRCRLHGRGGRLFVVGRGGERALVRARILREHALAGLLAFGDVADPSTVWGAPVGPTYVYWPVTLLVLIAGVAIAFLGRRLLHTASTTVGTTTDGYASAHLVRRTAGARALVGRSRTLRPSVDRPSARDVGYMLGRANGRECWASVEDSIVVLGPPRSGKGLHLVIPAILDAPGAVVTTSTRPDNLAATIRARTASDGPVAVFDPQGLASGVDSMLRWSPVRGCEQPQTAMARARALCTEPAQGVDNASFWAQQCRTVVRCLLHAAALAGCSAEDLYRWSLWPVAAEEAVEVLRTHPAAAPAWSTALESVLASDPRQRDSTWAMVANSFAALADPGVLAAVSPPAGEQFDPHEFLAERGTLYLLGTAAGSSATSNLVSAFIEDIVECARRIAASSPGARLDPPLALILDEAANYPLPSLPSLMSEGGGSGITTMVVLQSLAQARARWGLQEAEAIWDAAIVKLMLGGSGNSDDLRALSALIGTRRETRTSQSWGPDGRRSGSSTDQEVPVLDLGALRTLPFGEAVLLLRSVHPIRLRLQPWTKRLDARELELARTQIEVRLREAAIVRRS